MKVRYLSERRVPLAAISPLHPAMEFACEQVWIVYERRLNRAPIITGAQEDAHSENSLHYGKFPDPRLRALDFDDNVCSDPNHVDEVKEGIIEDLIDYLGTQFYIVWERDHLHVEYDPELR